MAEPFLGQISIVGFNFAPRGFAFCDGQVLPINQNQSLYSLLGTTYGGDGRTSFALPDLRGRTPVHAGSSNGTDFRLGQKTGEETVTLPVSQIPDHDHVLQATSDVATTDIPAANLVVAQTGVNVYGDASNLTAMGANSIANAGSAQAHDNKQPFLTLNYIIALQGLFPSRN